MIANEVIVTTKYGTCRHLRHALKVPGSVRGSFFT
jgi:hypothetical protein